MKKLIILFVPFLLGLTPIYDRHTSMDQVDEELRNLYLNVQPNQLQVFSTTPTITDVQQWQIVIFSSGVLKFILSDGTTNYQVTVSSIGGLK